MGRPLKVVVIGAGLSGLALAQGLKRNGIECVVFDKESTPRDRNWGVTIAWSHPLLAQLLPGHLYQRLPDCQPDPELDSKIACCESVIIRNGKTGETMVEPPFPGVRRLNIQKTRRIWSQDINVQYGKTLTDIETTDEGIVAHFHDGTTEPGTVLIGCDGGGSQVRRWMLGDEATARVLPYTFLNFPMRFAADQAVQMNKMMHPIVDVGVHPDKPMYVGIFLLDKPDLARPETWVFYILATWVPDEQAATAEGDPVDKSDANLVDELRRRIDDWAEPFKSAVEWTPPDVKAKAVPLRIWAPTTDWDNHGGRVTLGGDAAHSMTFHRGQGANNAIRDSERFVTAMKKVKSGEMTLEAAVAEYDADVISRGRAEVEVSRAQTDAFHHFESFKNSPIMKLGIRPVKEKEDKEDGPKEP